MGKRFKTGRLKKHQTYSVVQLSRTIGATEATVRRFLREGLTCIDDAKPVLVLGCHAKEFLGRRQAKAKRPLKDGQVYCLRCKAPRMPDGLLADYLPRGAIGGRLEALCEACGCVCNRPISDAQHVRFSSILDIVVQGRK